MKIHRCLNLLPIGREQLSLKREKKESSFQFEETGYKFVINLSLDSEI